ncbi:MAG: kelch repeat-containing protein [Phycisphaerae bacterium]
MFNSHARGGAHARFVTIAIACCTLLLSAPLALGGSDCPGGWTTPGSPGPRYGHAVAFDSDRGVLVTFGGRQTNTSPLLGDTWEYDGTRWRQTATSGPSPREQFAMAYHAGIDKVVLVGGLTADGERSDVWTYDAGGWAQLADGPFPPRRGHAAAYDSVRDRMVMHGGSQLDNITWLFDGTAWSSFTAGGPGARTGAAMAFDPIRRRVVLFGSDQASEPVGRVHEWNGAGWSRADPAGPSARGGCAMTYDPSSNRVLLFGGRTGQNTLLGDTWSWDGVAWQAVAQLGPQPRWRSSIAHHPALGVVLVGGAVATGGDSGNFAALFDDWQLDVADGWTSPDALPERRNSSALGSDELRGELVLFGGIDQTPQNSFNDQTWVRRNGAWQLRGSGSIPGARSNAALGYNPLTQTVFMVGGFAPGAQQQTWSWDGRAWTLLTNTGPSAVSGHATLFDPISQRMLLLRVDVPVQFWNATQWQALEQSTTPPTLVSNAFVDRAHNRIVIASPSGMHEWTGSAWNRIGDGISALQLPRNIAYDDARDVAVVWGGPPCGQLTCGTWEWDGTAWAQRSSAGPTAIDQFSMAFDAQRSRVVLFGGRDQQSVGLDAEWEWDGVSWTTAPRRRPPPLAEHAIAVDRRRGDVIMFGGRTATTFASATSDTWILDDGQWRRHASMGTGPAPRFDASLAYDEKRDVVVMLNGRSTSGAGLREVWEWDGQSWTQRWNGATFGPPANNQCPAFYDPTRQRVMVYAGLLFAWDGASWTAPPLTGTPPPQDAVLTVDTDRGVIVACATSATLFELLGNRWTLVNTEQTQPRPGFLQSGFSFHYDSSRRVCVLVGREANLPPTQPQQAWDWNGSNWTRRSDVVVPASRTTHAAAFDGRTGQLLIHGGANTNTQPNVLYGDFWALGGAAAIEIVVEPESVDAQPDETIELSCDALGAGELTYQWRFRSGAIDESEVYSGVGTPTLTIQSLSAFEEGGYDCVISDGCTDVFTLNAFVNVVGACLGDVSGDGRVDLPDIAVVLASFGRENVPSNFPPDIDRDGVVGLADLAYVLRNFGLICE